VRDANPLRQHLRQGESHLRRNEQKKGGEFENPPPFANFSDGKPYAR
jgi:hypothetical protein